MRYVNLLLTLTLTTDMMDFSLCPGPASTF